MCWSLSCHFRRQRHGHLGTARFSLGCHHRRRDHFWAMRLSLRHCYRRRGRLLPARLCVGCGCWRRRCGRLLRVRLFLRCYCRGKRRGRLLPTRLFLRYVPRRQRRRGFWPALAPQTPFQAQAASFREWPLDRQYSLESQSCLGDQDSSEQPDIGTEPQFGNSGNDRLSRTAQLQILQFVSLLVCGMALHCEKSILCLWGSA